MRAVIQRVKESSVVVDGQTIANIGSGMMILLGIEENDGHEDAQWLVAKIARLRIFADNEGVMNLDVQETRGEVLVVSQFTLHASTRKGNRPSYIKAARPETAIPLYEFFIDTLASFINRPVSKGIFGAMMDVQLINDGPVTIIIDSKLRE